MKTNYFVIPIITILVAALGSWFVSSGMEWYGRANLPSWTPSGLFISAMWTIIFILGAASALFFWNHSVRDSRFYLILGIFIINAFLNIFWSYLFFNLHALGLAVLDAGILAISIYFLIVFIWPVSRLASLFLFLYAGWATFAAYLTSVIWSMNV